MQREVTDGEGTRWTCVQAYAGLTQDGGGAAADAAAGEDGRVEVVCTPSGGAQTVRLRLAAGWEDECSDEELLREIEAGGTGSGA
ncbi:MAG TPA: hypothetical protein VF736_05190 [Pyrinomonadaceae bacterium]|jgi:hypothetical protein